MTGMTTAALLAMFGGAAWVAPLIWIDHPAGFTAPSVVPAGEYHTFVVGNAAACRVDAPAAVNAAVFIVKCYPTYVYGKWHLRAYYMPTEQQSDPTGLWAVRFRADLAPGRHEFTVHTSDQDKHPPVAYAFEVIDLALPAADIPFGMYFDFARFPPAYRGRKFQEMYYKDMSEHGMTTATVFTWVSDGKDQVRQFRLMQKYGLDRFPTMLLHGSGKDDPAIPEIDGTPFLIYGPDEPSLARRAACEASQARKLALGMKNVTAMSGNAAWAFGDLFDVWVVHRSGITPMLHEHAKRTGASVWQYHCGMRGTNAALQRYYSGLYTWAVGARGCFRWAYTHNKDSCVRPDGTWNSLMVNEYVLPTADGPMSTVGWEGVREGVLDYRVLRALERKIAAAAGNAEKAEAITAAALWLGRLKSSVDPKFYQDCERTNYFWDRPDTFDPGVDLEKMRAEAVAFLAD